MRLWNGCRDAFSEDSVWERAVRLGTGMLLCLGRHTVTGLITTTGGHDRDWSADYRLFERERFDSSKLYGVVHRETISRIPSDQPVVAFMDDTLLRKRGRKVSGTSWRRDPNGPKFCNNFVWAERFLQISGALPEEGRPGACRAIPFMLRHCPIPKKPSRSASASSLAEYRKLREGARISVKGAEAICDLRSGMNNDPDSAERDLVVSVDGSYTNSSVIRKLPEKTTLIGRIRKDAKLYTLPEPDEKPRRGRKRIYGNELPTPEKIRQSDDEQWQEVKAFTSDREHTFRVKMVPIVRSRIGGERNMSLMIIQPLRYRLSKKSKLLYRNPAYLICTDTKLEPSRILQWYLWRWQIEVNFRDQKTLLGMEEAAVRTFNAVEAFPRLVAFSYALMQLAFTAPGTEGKGTRRLPKWRRKSPPKRMTTGMMISEFRNRVWGLVIDRGNLSHFVNGKRSAGKLLKFQPDLRTAVLYAHR